MRICLITGIFPPDIGGPATYVSHLALSLHRNGDNLCVITLGDEGGKQPFPVKRISRTYPVPLRLLLLFMVLIRYGWRYEIWYINGVELPAVLAGKLLRKRMVLKVVGDYAWERAVNVGLTTDAIDEFQFKRQHWKVELHKRLRSWCAQRVEKIITPSYYLKRIVSGWGVAEAKIHVIYNAVEEFPETLPTKTGVRKQLGLPENKHLILTVGRLVSWKGIDRLINVIARLERDMSLLIIGDGPQKNKLTELANILKVTDRVRFLGKLERKQVLCYLRASDIFVLNSTYEGLPHVVLEAMSVGIPVVATAAGGTPELVQDGRSGRLIAPLNDRELHQTLLELLSSEAERRRLVEGANQQLTQFTFSKMLQETEAVLAGG